MLHLIQTFIISLTHTDLRLNFRLLGRVVFIPYEGEEKNMSFVNEIKFTTELKRAMDEEILVF